jgi:hypothetical protein
MYCSPRVYSFPIWHGSCNFLSALEKGFTRNLTTKSKKSFPLGHLLGTFLCGISPQGDRDLLILLVL